MPKERKEIKRNHWENRKAIIGVSISSTTSSFSTHNDPHVARLVNESHIHFDLSPSLRRQKNAMQQHNNRGWGKNFHICDYLSDVQAAHVSKKAKVSSMENNKRKVEKYEVHNAWYRYIYST